jgi:hypothetical protein
MEFVDKHLGLLESKMMTMEEVHDHWEGLEVVPRPDVVERKQVISLLPPRSMMKPKLTPTSKSRPRPKSKPRVQEPLRDYSWNREQSLEERMAGYERMDLKEELKQMAADNMDGFGVGQDWQQRHAPINPSFARAMRTAIHAPSEDGMVEAVLERERKDIMEIKARLARGRGIPPPPTHDPRVPGEAVDMQNMFRTRFPDENLVQGEGEQLAFLMELLARNNKQLAIGDLMIPGWVRCTNMQKMTTYAGVGGGNCYGMALANNIGAFPTRNANLISTFMHELFNDPGPCKFEGGAVNDEPQVNGFNETIASNSSIGNFSWGMTPTATTSRNVIYQNMGPRFYVRMSNKGKNNMDFTLMSFAMQMEYSRLWRQNQMPVDRRR